MLKPKTKRIIRLLAKKYHLKAVMLFGSLAKNNAQAQGQLLGGFRRLGASGFRQAVRCGCVSPSNLMRASKSIAEYAAVE